MREKHAKICNFDVKFDTKVEKNGVTGSRGLNKKRGSLGVGHDRRKKKGSIDRHLYTYIHRPTYIHTYTGLL